MSARPDLTQRLLSLGEAERQLLLDLYQARFADDALLGEIEALSGGSGRGLRDAGLLRGAETPNGPVHYLSATGQRAALSLLPGAQSAGRAYAALRLGHELRRAALYVALRRCGIEPGAYRAEPRLPYRSAAGLGVRTLVPDACVESGATWLLEVDQGTERQGQLQAKWLRYLEWRMERGDDARIGILASRVEGALAASLEATGLEAAVFETPLELAAVICGGGR